ncbi:MAG: T9SS type A sorting domain-containing protein [Flavobacterium sp.]|uniref:T9SS type A sorting domain-containing protein n=1 Tax=Flavobacterium sp. TaxID=239 RepID=UPI00120743EA|nr:T9SS type A sorting domain-containing protein [Flavobacterium sp.]RZJ66923.1 MAG: T9SS type A sorting domain-containing protein [Flavobacterium sp.]
MKNNYNFRTQVLLRKFLFTVMAILLSHSLSAQLTIPATNAFSSTNNRPIGAQYGYAETASIYLASDMNIPNGSTITGVRYFVETNYTATTVPIGVSLKNVSNSTYTAGIYNSTYVGSTYVYGGNITPDDVAAGKWITLNFTTPFEYTGSNLQVLVSSYSADDYLGSADKLFRWSTSSNRTQTWNSNIAPTYPGNGTVISSRPNIQILYNAAGATGSLSWEYPADSMLENRTKNITVYRHGGSTGAVSINYATSDGTAIAGSDYIATSGTLTWADGDMAPKSFPVTTLADFVPDNNETVNITLSDAQGAPLVGTNPMVLSITNVLAPMQGTYTVGVGGNFTSLTNAGGIFQAINTSVDGVSAPITINIISDITGETGNYALNQIAGGHSVLIQPVGAARTITGQLSTTANFGLLRFDGTDNVTINGSLTGATAASCTVGGDASLRQLTIVSNSVGTTSGILFQSAADGANNITVKNVNVIGYSPNSGYGIMYRVFPNSIAVPSTAHNENMRIENCSVKKASIGISAAGVSTSNQNTNLVITQNDVSATGAERVSRYGIVISNEINPQVTFNKVNIANLNGSDASENVGIAIGAGSAYSPSVASGGISGAMVSNNWVTGVLNTTTFGGSAVGIGVSGTSTGNPNIVQNNMVSNVSGLSQGNYYTAGIWVTGAVASVTKLYNNTINLYGDRGNQTIQSPSYGIALSGLDPSLEMRNNVISTTQIATGTANTKTYAFGTLSSTFNNLVSDNNVFYIGGAQAGGFRSGGLSTTVGTAHANLAAWQAVSGKDASSIQVQPVFVSQNDLHLVAGSNPTIDGIGTPIASVTNDFDCLPRNPLTPTPGASESNVAGFIISASAGTNGTISPVGTTSVPTNGNQTFTITPNCAYAVADVLVDGVSQGAITTYTFSNVNANHSISATFSATVPTITASGATTFCQGSSVTLTSSATTGNVWSTGATTQSITVTAAGSYTVSVNNGTCTSAASAATVISIIPAPAAPTVTASGATTFCQGASVTLTSSSATGNTWSNGATTQSITVSTSGTYSVVFNNGTCNSASSAGTTVTVNPAPATPTITATGPTTFCQGGSVILISSASSGNVWSNGATTQFITVTTSGTYTVSVNNGTCTSATSDGIEVTVNPAATTPTITASGTTTFCQGGSVTLTSSSATGNTWSNGATTQSITVSTSGTFTVSVSGSSCGSATSAGTTVTVNPVPTTPTVSASGATTFCQGGSVTLTSSATSGNVWSNGATTQSITVSTSGTYSVSVDNGSCTSASSATTTVTVTPLPATPTVSTSGATTFCQGGSVTLTSSSATGNIWSNGATTQSITVSNSGTYTVYVSNGSCSSAAVAGITVTVNPIPATPTISASGSTTICQGGNVTLTSSSATGNIWSNGATTQSITVSSEGTYTVSVTNGGCSSATSAGTTVTVNPTPATPTISASGSTTICQGASVTLTSSSATGNIWSNGATTQSITVSNEGTYTVYVSNGSCSSAGLAGITVTVNPTPATPTVSASGATTICQGGSVTLTSSSATGNTWSNGATTQSITVSTGGTYSVSLSNGSCTSATSASTTVTVNAIPATPTVSASGSTTICQGGSVTLTSSSATGNTWSNGATTQSITVSNEGTYSVSVSNGSCTSATSASTTITVNAIPATPTVSASGSTTICQGGSVTLTSSSATGNTWSNGATTQSITVSNEGPYSVSVTNGGCTSATSAVMTITVNPTPNAGLTQDNGVVTATETGATYQWYQCPDTLLSGETDQTFTPTVVGDYKVEITLGDCSVMSSCITVTQLGVGDFAHSKFEIYPNPVTDILNIGYTTDFKSVEVFNMIGQQVMTKNVNASATQLDMSGLPAGTYLVKVEADNASKTIKVIKR